MIERFQSLHRSLDDDPQDISSSLFHPLSARDSSEQPTLGAGISTDGDDLGRYNRFASNSNYELETLENLERTSSDVEGFLPKHEAAAIPGTSKGRRFWTVVIGIVLCDFLRGFDDTIVNAISPVLVEEFNALNQISWFASAYYFPQAALTVFLGKLTTIINLRWAWVISVATFTIGSVVCAVAPSASIFIIGRAVCGIGAAALLPIGLEMLFIITNEDERPAYIALVVGVEALASGIGPLIGAIFAEKLSFRYGFVANLAMIVGFGAMVFFAFNQQRRNKRPVHFWSILKKEFDLLGCALFLTSTLTILLGLQFAAQSNSWKTLKVILCLSVGGSTFIAFVVQQCWGCRKFKFVQASVTNREVGLSLLLGFFSIGSERVMEYFLAFYLQQVKGQAVIKSAYQTLPYLCTIGIGSLALGFVVGRIQYTNIPTLVGSTLLAVGSYLLTRFDETTPLVEVILLSLISGFGAGMLTVLTLSTAQRHVSEEFATVTMSLVLTMQLLGSTIGITLSDTLLNQHLSTQIENLDAPPRQKQLVIENLSQWHTIKHQLPQEQAARITGLFASATSRPFDLALVASLLGAMVAVHLRWYAKGTSYQSIRKKQ